jgi:hypothetical protein
VAADGIGDVYEGLMQGKLARGWADVQHQEDVHGYKPGIDLFAAVVFLAISGRSFWQIVSVGGGTASTEQAQQEIQQLQGIISKLEFL